MLVVTRWWMNLKAKEAAEKAAAAAANTVDLTVEQEQDIELMIVAAELDSVRL